MTRRCPGVSRAVRQVFYWCVCQRERKRELELLTPMKRDSAVCGWVQGTLFATCDCVCLLMNTSVSVWIHFKRAVQQWTSPVTTHYLALSHTHGLFCSSPAELRPSSPGQCRHRSPGAQEGHRQVWLETDPALRKACSHSAPIQPGTGRWYIQYVRVRACF